MQRVDHLQKLQRRRRFQRGVEKHQQKGRSRLLKKLIGRSTKSHALLMGAPIYLSKEECASSMVQRPNDAASKDAQIEALSTGQRPNDATAKDAQMKLRRDECALGMGQSVCDAALKDAQIKFKMEECASSMEQRSNDATVMGAKT